MNLLRLLRYWNWKAALMSSLYRGLLFFAANLGAGVHAATGAMLAEFAYRGVTGGYYGALTQAATKTRPRTAITAVAGIVVLSHAVEFTVHWLRGTPHLRTSIGLSVCFTALSTLFNLHAMRRGVLVTGSGGGSLRDDLRALPRTLASFGASLLGFSQ